MYFGQVPSPPKSFLTEFGTIESPLSQGGLFKTGLTHGLDWSDVEVTASGLATGTQTGTVGPPYNDSMACLNNGIWRPNVRVSAKIFTQNQQTSAGNYQEAELLGRWAISSSPSRIARGYEVAFRCTHTGEQYVGIVRWNGPLNSFDQLGSNDVGPGLLDNETHPDNPNEISATFITVPGVGVVITAYINGVQVSQQTDTAFTWLDGSPGFGLWHRGAGSNLDFGFKRWWARELAA